MSHARLGIALLCPEELGAEWQGMRVPPQSKSPFSGLRI